MAEHPFGPSRGALGVHRIMRGGSWNNNARNCRSANRNWNPAGYRNNNVGFRPVCSAAPSCAVHWTVPVMGLFHPVPVRGRMDKVRNAARRR